jgi:uncharacterized protein YdeI (YjbR/CyaY-like superfamily)
VSEGDYVEATTQRQWRDWLRRHHTREDGIWLVFPKKTASPASMDYEEIVCEALCWGWIDSRTAKVDERRTKLWIAPRRPASVWSSSNKSRIERLVASGRMQPAGKRAVEHAKSTGQWSKMDAVERLEVPRDLAAAFRRHAGAKRNWEGFSQSSRKIILAWIEHAVRPATRAARVEETAACAARGERANQPAPRTTS